MLGDGGAERCHHHRAGDPAVRAQVQHVSRVVIEPAHDLGMAAISEPVMGEVRLPALVRQLRLEPQVGRPRPLRRIGRHQPLAAEVPAHRRRGHGDAVQVLQVPADRLRPGVQTLPRQFLPQPGDQLDGPVADRIR
jgi:hypothetical protein